MPEGPSISTELTFRSIPVWASSPSSLAFLSSSLCLLTFLILSHFMPQAVGTDIHMATSRKMLTLDTARAQASRRPCRIFGLPVNDAKPRGPATITSSDDMPCARSGTKERRAAIRTALPMGTPRELLESVREFQLCSNRREAFRFDSPAELAKEACNTWQACQRKRFKYMVEDKPFAINISLSLGEKKRQCRGVHRQKGNLRFHHGLDCNMWHVDSET